MYRTIEGEILGKFSTSEETTPGRQTETCYPLYNQSVLNENSCSGDESSAKVLLEHPSTVYNFRS